MNDNDVKGCVFNIQKFSIHDGPGIRTIVFLKGCPLSCQWCSNPESQEFSISILFDNSKCNSCGKCLDVCNVRAINLRGASLIDRDKCINCGACADICPNGALIKSGNITSVKEILDEVSKDSVHFRRSNGGLTLSGGEPLAQPDFAEALLIGAKERGFHTTMETSGIAPSDVLKRIIPLLDLVLLDIKSFYTEPHEKFVGVKSEMVLKNALIISELANELAIRIPVIPGFNDDKKSISAIGSFATHLKNVSKIYLLPYHNYGQSKYKLINKEYEFCGVEIPSKTTVENFKKIIESFGFPCQIGG
ncbi:glycyl-radical enzyme activating protein [Shewanella sp. D64]|uniref:glycyl-radical enzyme activating protein n=1 Tax=unclassified Shewanella TaxID=196818 RepID=UPI0022BA3A75|nr:MULTISPECIES: glycyl-radical enzyme activating protein [unclassified Shewanella]MEC4725580.1 glycyl-radical enzyme activating protein [Shewanella sp. D64]MEC4739632.1 glycyl-radical enzyme activating protein [Shewanella sp. E94]WBJ94901.1 glycyl-radical enzyme activating protein [Shewanella sp. MTB7]